MIWNGSPVAFSVFGLPIRWYGISYILGYFLCERWGRKFLKQKISEDRWQNMLLGTFFFGIIGGRLGEFLFYAPEVFWNAPIEILKVWHGGMSIHGGLLGGVLFVLWYTKKHKINLLDILNSLTIPLSFGLAGGRIANFLNAEIIGTPTDRNWGVVFQNYDSVLRHPAQLYESFGLLLLGGILLWGNKKNWIESGLTVWFLVLYGVFRFLIEFWKESEIVFLGLKTGQILCLGMILIGGCVWGIKKFRIKK